jgi:N-acetylmuramoyl-L-alanine amidase CwlA
MLNIQQAIMPIGGNRTGYKKTGYAGVVIHYTANTGRGAGALGHKSYVTRPSVTVNGKVYESDGKGKAVLSKPFSYGAAQYYVDDKNIVQYIPEAEYAPHAGATTYKAGIKEKIGGTPNYLLSGIEICVNPESNLSTAINNAAELAAHLLKQYGLGTDRLFRHYDITGKNCPAMMISESSLEIAKHELKAIYGVDPTWIKFMPWSDFVAKVNSYLNQKPAVTIEVCSGTFEVTANKLNLRETPVNGKVLTTMTTGAHITVTGLTHDGWYQCTYNGIKGYCSSEFVKKVTVSDTMDIFVNGSEVSFDKIKPKVIEGSTYAPLSPIFKKLGWNVTWDGKTGTAKFANPANTLSASVTSKGVTITKSGKSEKSDAKFYFEEGTTCAQLSPLLKALGFTVTWDGKHGVLIK